MSRLGLLTLSLLFTACAGNGEVVEGAAVDRYGNVSVCSNQPGMTSCEDEVEEHAEEVSRDYTAQEEDAAMAKEAAAIRKETPAELEQTITNLENSDGSLDIDGNVPND
ncbi:MAG: hypothetical protein AAGA91_05830 [Pseudomonadota bacterium]